MLGNLSSGILSRSSEDLRFVCGKCNSISEVTSEMVPGALSLAEAASLHRCPSCNARSNTSKIVSVDKV